ncbi:hypothetical protein [Alkalitalea saponilacus]|uniref:Uncharacterized protein n=1 Tax=Alkalitalea saponilacus TaxID=889453 RepID=A0A1T5D428_9BACT|nr:hypothetical protein [Alkalitalea saponilacus]ASB50564.1 hypothetical protein CDL62_16140 [Alkalitalea saponilacus]SKB66260.1 hypothetical protein SAMN03080601_00960 [Alkalitalea saponilacus]
MELQINLLKNKKSRTRIFYGIILVLFSISFLIIKPLKDGHISTFDWVYVIVFMLLGIGHLIEGYGFSFSTFLNREAFVHIGDSGLKIKKDAFSKEKEIEWNHVKTIEYKSAQYKIGMNNNEIIHIDIPTDDYHRVQIIKESVNHYAEKNEIQIIYPNTNS